VRPRTRIAVRRLPRLTEETHAFLHYIRSAAFALRALILGSSVLFLVGCSVGKLR